MSIQQVYKPRLALNKAFLKVKPSRDSIEKFKYNLTHLLNSANNTESEEFHKNLLSDFLKLTYYSPEHFINTKGRNDLVIHNGKTAQTSVGVIIETKRPGSSGEMPNITTGNFNVKSFHELILYYLRERITNKNLEVKHLIITNLREWFIFDAQVFEKLFANDKDLVKKFADFEEKRLSGIKTDFFYKQIAEPAVATHFKEIVSTYFNFKDYERPLRNNNKTDDNQLIALFKLLSPEHLLKLPFANDSNTLDKSFYAELLHIIGLTETKEGGKKIIDRKSAGARDVASLMENTINQLDSLGKIERLNNYEQYGKNKEERLFNVGLELTITWINRILFLKLLEAQLITYHKGDKNFSFLNSQKIQNYDDLNSLFFQVLARRTEERTEDVHNSFAHVPYLNSSLFEVTDIEDRTIVISNLRDERELPLWPNTVLKDQTGKRLQGKKSALEYLFAFLDAYDFSSEGSENIQEENKTLINASVLGLIFEKINGYKDGSFFTPGFITMYMCRETLRKAVLEKFNTTKGWSCIDFEELYNCIDDKKEANAIINSIKICDPAVGSGHFLVSALNEMIAIKNDLKLLCDRQGKRLKEYSVEVVNDELVVTDDNGALYQYNPSSVESQRIQETLFHEKQTIIENCLFGVDINPNSVKICRLRLWIELLKNAYYKSKAELETLPNIDINIKCGNSLISRFDLKEDLSKILKRSEWSINDYKNAVISYRQAKNKEQKWEMEKMIAKIRTGYVKGLGDLSDRAKDHVRYIKLVTEQNDKYIHSQLFDKKLSKKELEYKKKLETEIENLASKIGIDKDNATYENAFEWRLDFPEVLNEDGDFIGFDAIIGNPPYIRIQGIREINSQLANEYVKRYKSASGSFDIYSLFVEQGLKLTTNEGIVNYIMPVKWTNAAFGSGLRQIVSETKSIYKIINFGSFQAFDASTYTGLQWFQKNSKSLLYFEIDRDFKTNVELGEYLNSLNDKKGSNIDYDRLTKDNWTLTVGETSNIIDKLNQQPRRMSDVFDKIFQGLATSKDDVYFLYNCISEREYIVGFSKQLNTTVKIEKEFTKPLLKGEDVHKYEHIKTDRIVIFPYKLNEGNAELYTEIEIESNFPMAYEYLKTCERILRDREKGRFNIDGEWFQFGRKQGINFAERQKIVGPEISKGGNFSYDQKGEFYSTTTVYGYIKKNEIPESYKALMAILNSQLFWWYLVNTGTVLANNYFRFKSNYIKPFPVPFIPRNIDLHLQELTDEILALKQRSESRGIRELEIQIDKIIYNLYNLTDQEIKIISSI